MSCRHCRRLPAVNVPGSRLVLALIAPLVLTACIVQSEPLTPAELASAAVSNQAPMAEEQEPVGNSIELAEAMARAVAYNLDRRVQQAEAVLKSRELASANLALLPGLVANAGYNGRNVVDASRSTSITTGRQSLETSTSQDRDINTADVALSWNLLDFGLSYVRAQQAADAALVSTELRRRVLVRLVEDVRSAYWRALASERLARNLVSLEGRARDALKQSREQVGKGLSLQAALGFQKEIYEVQDRLQTVEAEVLTAKAQLAALMNLPPGTPFRLVRPHRSVGTNRLPSSPEMLRIALENQPDMRQALYEARMTKLDARAALLETLPGIGVVLGSNMTSNSYTLHQEWLRWGAQATWNVMKVFSLPVRLSTAEARGDLTQMKVKALAASIALQVVVSRQRYELAQRRLRTAADYRDIEEEILRQLLASATAARTGDQEIVREQMFQLLAQARYDVAVADVEAAWAAVQTTMGRDPFPAVEQANLRELTAAFRARLSGREPSRSAVREARPAAEDAGAAGAAAGEAGVPAVE